jgi:hypothetical protein
MTEHEQVSPRPSVPSPQQHATCRHRLVVIGEVVAVREALGACDDLPRTQFRSVDALPLCSPRSSA